MIKKCIFVFHYINTQLYMNIREHKAYQKEFKAYSREITATKDSTKKFLIRSGINTPTGRLTKTYSSRNSSIKKIK